MRAGSGGMGDDGGERRRRDTETRGLGGELARLCEELRDARGSRGDHGATASSQIDEALIAEQLVGMEHRVLVHLEPSGDLAGGGQCMPDLDVPARDACAHRVGDLLVDRAIVRLAFAESPCAAPSAEVNARASSALWISDFGYGTNRLWQVSRSSFPE